MTGENRPFLATIALSPLRFEADTGVVRDGERACVFRGYLADRSAVRAVCGLGTSATDARLFLAAFEKWGVSLQRHVTGEYCGVIVDEVAGTAVLTVDAFNLRPLFYAQRRGRLHVASHLDALVGAIGATELCDEFVADHLTMSRHFGDRTIFSEIRRLEPGRPLEIREGR
ncbi:MAG TPA: hypothetical protein VMS40_11870, partial [Vicinamibacterales bacterium]|nr:hypothetical protein [Vicinamibacterales bacterium]